MLGFKSLPRVPTIPFLVGTLKTIPNTTKSDGTNTYTTKSDGTFSGFGSSTWAAPWDSYEFVGGTFDSACTESSESGLVSVVWGYWEQDTGSTGEVMPVYLRCEYSEYGISDDLSKQGAKSRYKFTPPLAEVSAAVAAGGVYKCPRSPPSETPSVRGSTSVAERFYCVEGCGLQARCGSLNPRSYDQTTTTKFNNADVDCSSALIGTAICDDTNDNGKKGRDACDTGCNGGCTGCTAFVRNTIEKRCYLYKMTAGLITKCSTAGSIY